MLLLLRLGAIFDAFGTIIPAIALFGVIYVVISFLIGISDASLAGFFFALGVILAGLAISDVVMFAGGFTALIVLIFLFFRGCSSGD